MVNDDPNVIYLQPTCGAGPEGRTWCENDVDACDCLEKHTNTKYIRADVYLDQVRKAQHFETEYNWLQRVLQQSAKQLVELKHRLEEARWIPGAASSPEDPLVECIACHNDVQTLDRDTRS